MWSSVADIVCLHDDIWREPRLSPSWYLNLIYFSCAQRRRLHRDSFEFCCILGMISYLFISLFLHSFCVSLKGEVYSVFQLVIDNKYNRIWKKQSFSESIHGLSAGQRQRSNRCLITRIWCKWTMPNLWDCICCWFSWFQCIIRRRGWRLKISLSFWRCRHWWWWWEEDRNIESECSKWRTLSL